MQIVRRGHGAAGTPAEQRSATFSGLVYAEPLGGADGTRFASVFFGPGARTYWHWHEHGQLLHVLTGRGWVCTRGEAAQLLYPGDVVWVPPGEQHWHGAGPDSVMCHLAVSLGTTNWLEEVTAADYRTACGCGSSPEGAR